MWESSFVAMSVLLGGSIDDALCALPERSQASVAELVAKLRNPKRTVRAQGLAVVAKEVADAIGEVTLR